MLLLALFACTDAPKPAGEPDPDSAVDSGEADSGEDTGASCTGLSMTVEDRGGATGALVVELTAADGTVTTTTGTAPGTLEIALADGAYGVRAWIDTDGDGAWDGTWEGEPTAILGLTLPRCDFALVLRSGVPTPILEDDPQWVELYDAAWAMAEGHIAAGTDANGLADHYMDEAFSEQIFQWDSCFMARFGRYGADAFPVMATLDNFYGSQREDGYICRVVDEDDGERGGAPETDPAEPMINPPLFGWVEAGWVAQTGDTSRMYRVLPALESYAGWIDGNVRTDPGLYYTSLLGSGMDNAPRDAAYDGWVDISAQQAMAWSAIESLGGDGDAAAAAICDDVRTLTWDDTEGFFFDVDIDGRPLTDKTLAGVWPLVAGCASDEQAARVVAHLVDPSEFWRTHVFPSTAADSSYYDPDGHYWRGGVWAPSTYATIQALERYGYRDVARAAAENHLTNLSRVYRDFAPADGELASDAEGDGTATLWELYAPDAHRPGTRWDDTWLGRQDFVGWSGLGPIALLLEEVVGLEADAPTDTLTWTITRTDRHGVQAYRFGDQLVDVIAEARTGPGEPIHVSIDTSDTFTLCIVVSGARTCQVVPAGESTVVVDPSDDGLAGPLVPAGPFAGYAVIGNGRISAVVSDHADVGAPGIAHLYVGNFGLDLLEEGTTHVGGTRTRLGLDPFFAAYAEEQVGDGTVAWRTFVGEHDAVVVQGVVEGDTTRVCPRLRLRDDPSIDGNVTRVGVTEQDGALLVSWSDGTTLAFGMDPAPDAWQAGTLTGDPLDGLDGVVVDGPDLALCADIPAGAFRWAVATDADTLADVFAAADPVADAEATWADFADACDAGERCRSAAANLYAARASSLGGAVPADLTGQFVTDGFPQLYPRDALQVARAMHAIGRDDEAWEIVHGWLAIPGPQTGEWYARYDALGRGIDGGSGAAYDTPEWDAVAYLAGMVERLGADGLDTSERETLLDGLDFLVASQDENGLYWEGGIVEWVGYLPSTAMIAWAGLDAGARLADGWGEDARAADYRAAGGRIRGGLWEVYDADRDTLIDVRDSGSGWDTSLLFGPVWGYPAGPVTDASFVFAREEASLFGDGVRYFEGMSYGEDLFFFTTSAASTYASTLGDTQTATDLVDWMTRYSNVYGLAPERVYSDGSGASVASPLSWCAAEAGLAWLAAERVVTPVLDGEVDAAEYGARGLVDMDGLADAAGDPVAVYALRDGDDLHVGVRLAGSPGETVTLWLSGEDGLGDVTTTAAGALRFRADAGEVSGAVARVEIDADGACRAGGAADVSLSACDGAAGVSGLEALVDLAAFGLSGDVQVILEAGQLLPETGSLWTGDLAADVLVRFQVEADAGPVNLSGDRAELGAWAGDAVALYDDGTHGDATADDGVWTVAVALPVDVAVAYKYMVGTAGDGSWDGVEFDGDNRTLQVRDADNTGTVGVLEAFGVRGGEVVDW